MRVCFKATGDFYSFEVLTALYQQIRTFLGFLMILIQKLKDRLSKIDDFPINSFT